MVHVCFHQCKKKHTLVCPDFSKSGSCPRGSRCKLQHRQRVKRSASTTPVKKARTKEPLKRYYVQLNLIVTLKLWPCDWSCVVFLLFFLLFQTPSVCHHATCSGISEDAPQGFFGAAVLYLNLQLSRGGRSTRHAAYWCSASQRYKHRSPNNTQWAVAVVMPTGLHLLELDEA